MRSDRSRAAIKDILRNIELAEEFVGNADLNEFLDNVLCVYATTRALEIVSEASRRLPDELKARHPIVPWRDIATAGNIYRHGYDVVVGEIIWETVKTGLNELRNATGTELTASI